MTHHCRIFSEKLYLREKLNFATYFFLQKYTKTTHFIGTKEDRAYCIPKESMFLIIFIVSKSEESMFLNFQVISFINKSAVAVFPFLNDYF